jgi:GMP synthase (glutamine-hydrolysing)
MSKTASVLRHVPFEDLGAFETKLTQSGYTVRYFEMGMDVPEAAGDPDLLVILGGPIGVYEDALYPFLVPEIAYIKARLEAKKPTLGICLGAQLMAKALGARVYPGRGKEIGWKALTLMPEGSKLLAPFKGMPVLHWHGDTFDLPPGASNLASTDLCDHQAYAIGAHALAFQFHPEAQEHGFERWLIGHACEIAGTKGVSATELRAATQANAAASAKAGCQILETWLKGFA